jgi:hypothetical protein
VKAVTRQDVPHEPVPEAVLSFAWPAGIVIEDKFAATADATYTAKST